MSIPEGWKKGENGKSISRQWKFENFVKSLEFVNKLGELAEEANHHPDIEFGWGYANITFTTHDEGNTLSDKDIAMAQRVNDTLVA